MVRAEIEVLADNAREVYPVGLKTYVDRVEELTRGLREANLISLHASSAIASSFVAYATGERDRMTWPDDETLQPPIEGV